MTLIILFLTVVLSNHLKEFEDAKRTQNRWDMSPYAVLDYQHYRTKAHFELLLDSESQKTNGHGLKFSKTHSKNDTNHKRDITQNYHGEGCWVIGTGLIFIPPLIPLVIPLPTKSLAADCQGLPENWRGRWNGWGWSYCQNIHLYDFGLVNGLSWIPTANCRGFGEWCYVSHAPSTVDCNDYWEPSCDIYQRASCASICSL